MIINALAARDRLAMRIAFFTNNFFPRISGVGVALQTMQQELNALGHRIFIIAPEYRSRFRFREHEPLIQRVHSFRFRWYDRLSMPLPFINASLIRNRLQMFRPDLIHLHHPWLLGAYGLKLGKIFRIPTVFTYHTLYDAYTHYFPGNQNWWKVRAVASSLKVCNQCDAVIAPSSLVKEYLEHRGVHTPIEVIPTGVSLKDFRDQRFSREDLMEMKTILGFPLHDRVFLYVGRMSEEKNLELLITSIRHVLEIDSHACFLLIGPAPKPHWWKWILQKVSGPRVKWIGAQDRALLPKYYQLADAFLFPSISDTQGIVLYEAIASGLPIIACDSLAARACIPKSGKEIGWICENHPSDFAMTIMKFLNQGVSPLTPIQDYGPFGLRRMANRLIAFYHRLSLKT